VGGGKHGPTQNPALTPLPRNIKYLAVDEKILISVSPKYNTLK